MKLEVKHLKNYLGYNLKVESQFGTGDLDYKGLKKEMTLFNLHKIDGEKWKPLLRPISHLIKPCLPNGLTPLFEIANDLGFDVINSDSIETINGYQNDCFFVKIEMVNGENELWYFPEYPCIRLKNNDYGFPQLEVFEKLFEWNFDVYGLIDEGLARPLI